MLGAGASSCACGASCYRCWGSGHEAYSFARSVGAGAQTGVSAHVSGIFLTL